MSTSYTTSVSTTTSCTDIVVLVLVYVVFDIFHDIGYDMGCDKGHYTCITCTFNHCSLLLPWQSWCTRLPPSRQPVKPKPWAVPVGCSRACGSLPGPWAVTGPVTSGLFPGRARARLRRRGVPVSVAVGLRYRPGRATRTVHPWPAAATTRCGMACT